MAIMTSCCCWKSVRSGSYACAIYTMIFYSIVLTAGAFHVRTVMHSPALLTFSLLMVILSITCVVTSAILIIGLCTNNRNLFIPWLVSIALTTVLDIVLSFYLIMDAYKYLMSIIRNFDFDPFIAVLFVTDIFICALNVYCLLCVLSQYQMVQGGQSLLEMSSEQRHQILRCPQSSYNTSSFRTPSTMTSTISEEPASSAVYLLPPTAHRRPSFSKPLLYPELSTISEEHPHHDPLRRKYSTTDINTLPEGRVLSPNPIDFNPYRRLSLNFPFRVTEQPGGKPIQVQLASPLETSVAISEAPELQEEESAGSPTSV